MCLISFAGFLRFSELVNLRRSGIVFQDDHMSLFIQKSRTVHIACTDGVTCTVRMTRRYLELSNMTDQSDQHLFRPITYCKTSNIYVLRGQKYLSYIRARGILLDALQSMSVIKSKFGLQSLRPGGKMKVFRSIIQKKNGRWKSDSTEDGYVSENIKRQLLVTKILGI